MTYWTQFFGWGIEGSRQVVMPLPQLERLLPYLEQFEPRTVIDLGTGTGCIALWATQTWPNAEVWATDLNLHHSVMVKRNAPRAHFALADRFWPRAHDRKFDLVIANPPHDTEAAWLAAADAHDIIPKEALVSGEQGTECLAYILDTAAEWTTPDAHLALVHAECHLEWIKTYSSTWKYKESVSIDDVYLSLFAQQLT